MPPDRRSSPARVCDGRKFACDPLSFLSSQVPSAAAAAVGECRTAVAVLLSPGPFQTVRSLHRKLQRRVTTSGQLLGVLSGLEAGGLGRLAHVMVGASRRSTTVFYKTLPAPGRRHAANDALATALRRHGVTLGEYVARLSHRDRLVAHAQYVSIVRSHPAWDALSDAQVRLMFAACPPPPPIALGEAEPYVKRSPEKFSSLSPLSASSAVVRVDAEATPNTTVARTAAVPEPTGGRPATLTGSTDMTYRASDSPTTDLHRSLERSSNPATDLHRSLERSWDPSTLTDSHRTSGTNFSRSTDLHRLHRPLERTASATTLASNTDLPRASASTLNPATNLRATLQFERSLNCTSKTDDIPRTTASTSSADVLTNNTDLQRVGGSNMHWPIHNVASSVSNINTTHHRTLTGSLMTKDDTVAQTIKNIYTSAQTELFEVAIWLFDWSVLKITCSKHLLRCDILIMYAILFDL